MSLQHVRFVLVRPSHPGNIGATARAMKVMGLSRLVLVEPKEFPSAQATARASGADDILASAQVVSTLEEGLQGVSRVYGTSARERSLKWPTQTPREVAEALTADEEIAVVFGAEQSGLSNAELAMCHVQIRIPVNPDFSSLNLSQAVQVIAYELHQSASEKPQPLRRKELACANELEGFFQHLEESLYRLQFLDRSHPKRLMLRLRQLFHRAEMDKQEVNIMRGVLSAIHAKVPAGDDEGSQV